MTQTSSPNVHDDRVAWTRYWLDKGAYSGLVIDALLDLGDSHLVVAQTAMLASQLGDERFWLEKIHRRVGWSVCHCSTVWDGLLGEIR